jgi:hypothetical protein
MATSDVELSSFAKVQYLAVLEKNENLMPESIFKLLDFSRIDF